VAGTHYQDSRFEFLKVKESAVSRLAISSTQLYLVNRYGGRTAPVGCIGDGSQELDDLAVTNLWARRSEPSSSACSGDKAYDSDRLDHELAERYGVDLIT
jgi:hypothetical protein